MALIPGAIVFGLRLSAWEFFVFAVADHYATKNMLDFPVHLWGLHNFRLVCKVAILPPAETRSVLSTYGMCA